MNKQNFIAMRLKQNINKLCFIELKLTGIKKQNFIEKKLRKKISKSNFIEKTQEDY